MDHPITRLSIDNLEEVNAFLLENFFTKEPLGLRLGIDPERDVRPWLSRVTEPLIRQNVSCVALDEDNNIIALSLNRIDYVDRDKNIPAFAEAVAGKDIFMNKILEFMEVLYQDVNFFAQHSVEKIFVFNMICVASQATGKGLATKLMKWSERIAHEEAGCKVLTAETTGAASARVFEKMAFEKANVLEYDDFIDKIGQKPFEHLDPHKSCIAWIKVKEIQS